MKKKIFIIIGISLLVLLTGIAVGSVYVSPGDIFDIILHKVFAVALPEKIKNTSVSIVWNLRLPRTLLAFAAGAALSVSGAVMQSILRNPLASSYTLGVSSGASFGACLVILYGVTIPVLPMLTLPIMGILFGIGTIILAVALVSYLDEQMENNSIILIGMIFSLFMNAITTLLTALAKEHTEQLMFWQMGSFSTKNWSAVGIVAGVAILLTIVISHFSNELDIMTFGEEQARLIGVDLKRVKWMLLIISAVLTGSTIAFVGIIGFVDLAVPHIVRRLFGASHKYVIPMSAIVGGIFMVVCDLVARTIVSPNELPVGAVTALLGAPFFAFIYFSKQSRKRRKRKKTC